MSLPKTCTLIVSVRDQLNRPADGAVVFPHSSNPAVATVPDSVTCDAQGTASVLVSAVDGASGVTTVVVTGDGLSSEATTVTVVAGDLLPTLLERGVGQVTGPVLVGEERADGAPLVALDNDCDVLAGPLTQRGALTGTDVRATGLHLEAFVTLDKTQAGVPVHTSLRVDLAEQAEGTYFGVLSGGALTTYLASAVGSKAYLVVRSGTAFRVVRELKLVATRDATPTPA